MTNPQTEVVRDPFFMDLVTAINSRPPPSSPTVTYSVFLENTVRLISRVTCLTEDDQTRLLALNEDFIEAWGRGRNQQPSRRLCLLWGFVLHVTCFQPWVMRSGATKLDTTEELVAGMMAVQRERAGAQGAEGGQDHEALEVQWMPLISKLTGGL